MNKIRIITIACLLVTLLTACAPSPSFVQTAIANTQTAIAFLTPSVTPTPIYTATIANPPTITNTPTPRYTFTITNTPLPSNTPTMTPTNTPQPGIGDKFNCGDVFTVIVPTRPTMSSYAGYSTANGVYLIVPIDLINNTTQSVQIWENDYFVNGNVNGQTLTFSVDETATANLYLTGYGISDSQDTINPSVTWKTEVAFDVNPNGTNWVLVLKPGSGINQQICEVDIPLTKNGK